MPRRHFVAQLPVVDEALLAAEIARDPAIATATPSLTRFLRRSPGGVSIMRRLGALLLELPEEVREDLRLDRVVPPDLGQPRLSFRAAQHLVSAPLSDHEKRQRLVALSNDRLSPAALVAELRASAQATRGGPALTPEARGRQADETAAAQAHRLGLPTVARAAVQEDGTMVFSYALDPLRVRFAPDRELEDLMRFTARLLEIGVERTLAVAGSTVAPQTVTGEDRTASFLRAEKLAEAAMSQRARVLASLAQYRSGQIAAPALAAVLRGAVPSAAPGELPPEASSAGLAPKTGDARGVSGPLVALPPIEVSHEELEADLA